jgi:hypothetical protein
MLLFTNVMKQSHELTSLDSRSKEIADRNDWIVLNVGGMRFRAKVSNFAVLPQVRFYSIPHDDEYLSAFSKKIRT